MAINDKIDLHISLGGVIDPAWPKNIEGDIFAQLSPKVSQIANIAAMLGDGKIDPSKILFEDSKKEAQKMADYGVISTSSMKNYYNNTVSVWFKTTMNSVVSIDIPWEVIDDYPQGYSKVFNHALRHGTVRPLDHPPITGVVDATGKTQLVFDASSQFKVLLGGSKTGEVVDGMVEQITRKAGEEVLHVGMTPLSGKIEKLTFNVEVYRLEKLKCMYEGTVYTCFVYRHPSVPNSELVGLFLDALMEFPVLRAIPDYNIFWRANL